MPGDFTDLDAFKEGMVLLEMVGPIASALRGPDAAAAAAQLISAAESVTSNIAEGYGRGISLDYARMLKIAIASAAEVEARLLSAVATRRIAREKVSAAIAQARRVRAITTGLKKWVESRCKKA